MSAFHLVFRGCHWTQAAIFTLLALFFLPNICHAQEVYSKELSLAVQMFGNKKYEAAATVLENIVLQYPDSAAAFLWLGRTKLELAQWSSARIIFSRHAELVTTPAERAEDYSCIALTHKKEGNCGLAEDWCQKAFAVLPSDAGLLKVCNEPCDEVKSRVGFWRGGIFEICGGGKTWWSWILGLLIYLPGLFIGSAQGGAVYKGLMINQNGTPEGAGGIAFTMGLIGAVIGFIVFWGVPGTLLKWIVLGFVCISASGIAWSTATARD